MKKQTKPLFILLPLVILLLLGMATRGANIVFDGFTDQNGKNVNRNFTLSLLSQPIYNGQGLSYDSVRSYTMTNYTATVTNAVGGNYALLLQGLNKLLYLAVPNTTNTYGFMELVTNALPTLNASVKYYTFDTNYFSVNGTNYVTFIGSTGGGSASNVTWNSILNKPDVVTNGQNAVRLRSIQSLSTNELLSFAAGGVIADGDWIFAGGLSGDNIGSWSISSLGTGVFKLLSGNGSGVTNLNWGNIANKPDVLISGQDAHIWNLLADGNVVVSSGDFQANTIYNANGDGYFADINGGVLYDPTATTAVEVINIPNRQLVGNWSADSLLIGGKTVQSIVGGVIQTNFLRVTTNATDSIAAKGDWSKPFSFTNALAKAAYGDVIYLDGGTHSISNIFVPSGVKIQGIGSPTILVDNTLKNAGTTADSSIYVGNDVTFRQVTIRAVNTNNYGSFFAGQTTAFTNLLIQNCTLISSWDCFCFQAPWNDVTVENTYIEGQWDLAVGQRDGNLVTRNCTLVFFGGANQGEEFSIVFGRHIDYGSRFYYYNDTGIAHFNSAFIAFAGTQIFGTNTTMFGSNSVPQNRSGSYFDVYGGRYVSIGADGASFYRLYSTNSQLVYTNSGIVVSGASVLGANGTYLLKTNYGDIYSFAGQQNTNNSATWTNTANGYRITLNSSAGLPLTIGVAPVYCIATNGNETLFASDQPFTTSSQLTWSEVTAAAPAPTSVWFTNTTLQVVTTNFYPQMFSGAIKQTNSATLFTGNGAGLTNLNATNLVGTVQPSNLPALNYITITNGTAYNLTNIGVRVYGSAAKTNWIDYLPSGFLMTNTAGTFVSMINGGVTGNGSLNFASGSVVGSLPITNNAVGSAATTYSGHVCTLSSPYYFGFANNSISLSGTIFGPPSAASGTSSSAAICQTAGNYFGVLTNVYMSVYNLGSAAVGAGTNIVINPVTNGVAATSLSCVVYGSNTFSTAFQFASTGSVNLTGVTNLCFQFVSTNTAPAVRYNGSYQILY